MCGPHLCTPSQPVDPFLQTLVSYILRDNVAPQFEISQGSIFAVELAKPPRIRPQTGSTAPRSCYNNTKLILLYKSSCSQKRFKKKKRVLTCGLAKIKHNKKTWQAEYNPICIRSWIYIYNYWGIYKCKERSGRVAREP